MLAERVGFEPTVVLPLRLISSQVHSTTLPPLLCVEAFEYSRDFSLVRGCDDRVQRASDGLAACPTWARWGKGTSAGVVFVVSINENGRGGN